MSSWRRTFSTSGSTTTRLQALNRAARNDPNHLDEGRREITFRDSDAFKFRTLTLRQLRDAKFFFHNGFFTSVKDVVRYFNAGVPQNAQAAAASSFTTRFSHPRGPGSPSGLGLSDDQVDDLTDFIENALYDPAFVHFHPNSTTDTLKLNDCDVMYLVYRPDLAALGAVDGRPGSGRPQDNDDALSRRDMGLEFLDVTSRVNIALVSSTPVGGGRREDVYRITNNGAAPVDTHLLLIARGLSFQVELENASGRTSAGDPYIREFLPEGVLLPGQSIVDAHVQTALEDIGQHTPHVAVWTGQPVAPWCTSPARDFAVARSRASRNCALSGRLAVRELVPRPAAAARREPATETVASIANGRGSQQARG